MKYVHLPALLTALLVLASLQTAGAQTIAPPPAGYSGSRSLADFLEPTGQPRLSATLFGGGFMSQDYGVTEEGLQLEQSLTERIGLVGRATGYQLFIEKNATSPLAPSAHTVARQNFGRFEGGLDFSLAPGTNLTLLGGHDVADSDAYVIEGDISSWLFSNTAHPVNFFATPIHDFQNGVTQSEVDLRVLAERTQDWDVLAGAGGAVYGGGFISGLQGQGGPILDLFNRPWQAGADMQVGYGSPGVYGEIIFYKTITWLE